MLRSPIFLGTLDLVENYEVQPAALRRLVRHFLQRVLQVRKGKLARGIVARSTEETQESKVCTLNVVGTLDSQKVASESETTAADFSAGLFCWPFSLTLYKYNKESETEV